MQKIIIILHKIMFNMLKCIRFFLISSHFISCNIKLNLCASVSILLKLNVFTDLILHIKLIHGTRDEAVEGLLTSSSLAWCSSVSTGAAIGLISCLKAHHSDSSRIILKFNQINE